MSESLLTPLDLAFLLSGGVTIAMQLLFFAFAAALKIDKVTDLAGCTNFVVLAAGTLFLSFDLIDNRRIVLTSLVCASRLELAAFLFYRVLKRGKDFTSREEVEAILLNDPEYKGKAAVLAEFTRPTETLTLSSKEYGAVHSLDIVTMRTSDGVKVLTVLLWTDCDGWSSHSTHAGYLVDVDTENYEWIVAAAPSGWWIYIMTRTKCVDDAVLAPHHELLRSKGVNMAKVTRFNQSGAADAHALPVAPT